MKFAQLLSEFQSELEKINENEKQIIKKSNRIVFLCRTILSEMNQIVVNTSFINEQYEINFFKHIKSIPLSQLIYFSEVKDLELKYPKVGISNQQKFLERKIKRVNKFFYKNIEFVSYIQNEFTHLDSIYFTRKSFTFNCVTPIRQYYRAPELSTSHDFIYSKIKAFYLLSNYIQNKLFHLLEPNENNQYLEKKSQLRWTSSKVALTELIYALHSCGAVNKGNIDLKELANIVENVFNVKLGDYYRTYLEMKMRKSSRTKFIDNLKNALEDKMNQSDD